MSNIEREIVDGVIELTGGYLTVETLQKWIEEIEAEQARKKAES